MGKPRAFYKERGIALPEVTIHHRNKKEVISVPDNMILLEALRMYGYDVPSPCGGKGTCGKCRVKLLQPLFPHTSEEKKHLSAEEMRKGIHLSCMTRVSKDLELSLVSDEADAFILTEANEAVVSGSPVYQKRLYHLPVPGLQDQKPDLERILTAYKGDMASVPPALPFQHQAFPHEVLQKLPEILREKDFQVTLLDLCGQPSGVEAGNTEGTLYGVAIDIGTTTLAAYLYDLNRRERLNVASMINPQKKYGDDVISRIDYQVKSQSHAREIAGLIRTALNELIERLAQSRGLKSTDIYLVTVAANTTMIHLLLQLPAIYLAKAPFIPATVSMLSLTPEQLDLTMNPQGRVLILPGVSAYVGSDTVAAVLSAGMHRREEVTLLVDIGTNGEVVLGSRDFLYACSTAAGPAFEGANISCGTGGVEGAISEVSVGPEGNIHMRTIGDKAPIGICGSGLIDAIACMLDIGILEDTGRISDQDELDVRTKKFADRLIEVNGQPAFLLQDAQDHRLYITQKDVREVQNAKAAIMAGITVLIREAGLTPDNIQKVYLAGGFGSFMRIRSAITVGLLPRQLENRIHVIGNAAGAGAIQTLLSREELLMAGNVASKIKYLEISSRPDFVNEYTSNMIFGNTSP